MRRARLLVSILVLPVLASCTGGSATPSLVDGSPSGVDPLAPYSPSPTPFVERTAGFIPDTLTLPTTGVGKLFVTPVTTTMTTAYVNETRAFVVYLTVENPSDTPWTGTIGADAQVKDLTGKVFPAGRPAPGDLHPDPARYGGSNRNVQQRLTVSPGATTSGALVFHVTGGNRPITLRISLDGGTTWGEWSTNLGVF
jgi:hypothetical protein